MQYILVAFIAGILTVLAPCVFTLLPIILGGSLTGKNWKKPAVIISSLSLSIFIFTLILKASTVFISVDPDFWKYLSGGLLIFFGILTIFPRIWSKIDVKLGLSAKSDNLLHKGASKSSFVGDVLVGAALGPVFSSCSPTYAIIIATILPLSPAIGVLNLIIYILGLAMSLSIISIAGQALIKRAKWAVNPNGIFKRSLGVIFIIVGLAIFTGLDKKFETYLLDKGFFDVTKVEINLLKKQDKSMDKKSTNEVQLSVEDPYKAPEIQGIEHWINSEPLTLESLKGKVVLVDFWTYSCINCVRTLPYMTSWYEKYKDDGLVIIGVHSPEFAFEKEPLNVEKAVENYGISYPVAMDNNFSTWSAYGNRYWPAGYFIDRDGNVVHTHFGEGDYEENEKIIQYLLGLSGEPAKEDVSVGGYNSAQTPETYLGYDRAERFLNKAEFVPDSVVNYTAKEPVSNSWSLEGEWLGASEKIISKRPDSRLVLSFNAKDVYLVMGAQEKKTLGIEVYDGDKLVSSETVEVSDYDLYTVVKGSEFVSGYRLVITAPEGLEMSAFTFGG